MRETVSRVTANLASIAIFVIVLLGLTSCCTTNTSYEKTTARPLPNLKNITLNITDLSDRPAQLVNGVFIGDHLRIQLSHEAVADLNQDGLIDGVVIIIEDTGGSGNFRKVCLLLNNGNELIHTDSAFIGDRIKIINLAVIGGIVTVDYMDRSDKDSYSTDPYIEKKKQYWVHSNGLELLQVD